MTKTYILISLRPLDPVRFVFVVLSGSRPFLLGLSQIQSLKLTRATYEEEQPSGISLGQR